MFSTHLSQLLQTFQDLGRFVLNYYMFLNILTFAQIVWIPALLLCHRTVLLEQDKVSTAVYLKSKFSSSWHFLPSMKTFA